MLSSAGMATALAVLLPCLLLRPTNATTIALPSEIVDFVPSCATSCLSTFIDINFPAGVCGSEPTFQCLCAHAGSNGFTVGEGAVACIASEDKTGQCTGTDVAATASQIAYSMCYGQPSAAPETHATIVATRVIPFQSQSTKTVTTTVDAGPAEESSGTDKHTTTSTSTTKTTSSSTRTSTSIRTTAKATETTESPLLTDPLPLPTPATATTATSHITATQATVPASTASSAQAGTTSDQNQPTSHTPSLSVAQIVGISVGTAAGLFVAIALSLYLRRVRHRRLRTVPKLTGDNRDIGNGSSDGTDGFRKRFRPRTGHELQISVPVNLQAPRNLNRPTAMPWQEKNNNYSPRQVQNNIRNNSSNDNNNRYAPLVPPKNSPVAPIPKVVPQPIQASAAMNNSRGVTDRLIVARYESPQGESLVPPATANPNLRINPQLAGTQTLQNSISASVYNAPLSQQASSSRQPKTPVSARTMAYPSYYGISPDNDLPNFGFSQPATATQPLQPLQPSQRQQPSQPMRPVQYLQPIQQPQQRPQNKFPSVFQPPPASRDSVVTEFAEDGEDLSSRGEDDANALFPQTQPLSQPRAQSRPQFLPLPQFQVRQHEPQLRPQPRTPPTRDLVNSGTQPFMSPSLIPRPLDLPRNTGPQNRGQRDPGNPTLAMPLQAGSNVSRMAKMRASVTNGPST